MGMQKKMNLPVEKDEHQLTLALEIEDLTYTYPRAERPSLSEISLKVEVGKFTVIMGATGAGKTTLTLCLNGLIPQLLEGTLEGKVSIGGYEVSHYRTQSLAQVVGMVFQDPESQIIGITVAEDVAFGPRNLGLPEKEVQLRVKEALSRVRLSGYESRVTETLSGGEKQRLALAGVLAMRPDILVLDEPTSELDPAGREEIFSTLDELRREKEMTIFLVEHAAEDALPRADEVVVLCQGKVGWKGDPAELFRNLFLLQTLGLRPVPISLPFAKLAELGRFEEENIPLNVVEASEVLLNRLGLNHSASIFSPQPRKKGLAASLEPHRGSIVIKDLSHCYENGKLVLQNISLSISAGEFVALIGANGAGKTTLTKHLNGLLEPSNGEIWISGKKTEDYSPSQLTRIVGYVFQNPDHQIFEVSVEREIAYGLRNRGLSVDEANNRVDEVLDLTGLQALRHVHPLTLGRGQRQLLAVASIIALQPEILVIDEPTTGLDWTESQNVMNVVSRLHKQGTTILMITHDMEWVAEYAERVIVLNEGKIISDGDPREVFYQRGCLRESCLMPPQVVQVSQSLERELGFGMNWLRKEDLLGILLTEGEEEFLNGVSTEKTG